MVGYGAVSAEGSGPRPRQFQPKLLAGVFGGIALLAVAACVVLSAVQHPKGVVLESGGLDELSNEIQRASGNLASLDSKIHRYESLIRHQQTLNGALESAVRPGLSSRGRGMGLPGGLKVGSTLNGVRVERAWQENQPPSTNLASQNMAGPRVERKWAEIQPPSTQLNVRHPLRRVERAWGAVAPPSTPLIKSRDQARRNWAGALAKDLKQIQGLLQDVRTGTLTGAPEDPNPETQSFDESFNNMNVEVTNPDTGKTHILDNIQDIVPCTVDCDKEGTSNAEDFDWYEPGTEIHACTIDC